MMTSNEEDISSNSTTIHDMAMQLTTAIVLPMALKTTIELGLLDIIANAGPPGNFRLSPSEITARLVPRAKDEEHASQMIDRVLRLLSSYSVVTCYSSVADNEDEHGRGDKDGQVQRFYGLAPLSCYFIQGQGNKDCLSPLFNVVNDKVMTDVWYHMKDAILEGQVPFTKAYGMNAKEYISKDERFAPIFQNSMRDFNPMFMNKVLDIYNGFEGLKLIVDVGGGNGSILEAIISKYPTINGINFDLPQVIENLPNHQSIENVPGDMFTMNIPQGDAIFMKWILKNIDDGQCLKLLKKCFDALPDGGKLMIVELVIPDIPDTNTSSKSIFQYDLYLTNMNIGGGKERTVGEFQALAKAVGFSGIQAVVQAFNITLLEFAKIATTS